MQTTKHFSKIRSQLQGVDSKDDTVTSMFGGRPGQPNPFGNGDENETMDGDPLKGPKRGKLGPALRYIGYTLIVAATTAGGIFAWRYFDAGIPVEVVTVQQGTLSKMVNGIGHVISRKQVDLTTGIPGQVTKVLVKEGDKVKKGDVLAQLDDREAGIGVKKAEAALLNAQSEVTLTERSLEQMIRSAKLGEVPKGMIDDVETALKSARARKQIAEEEVRGAELSLERLRVTAPFAGVVTQNFAVEGLWVEPPAPLFSLVDMAQLEAAIRVDPSDARDITPGQSVTMASAAFPAHEWTETVSRIVPASEKGNRDFTTVYVSLDSAPGGLKYGHKVEGQVVTETTAAAIKLPYEAILTRNGKDVVAIVDEGRVFYRPVELGIQALAEVQIVSGLKVGQTVILPRQTLEEGQKVEANKVEVVAEDEEGFPYREKFADVEIYSTEQLRKNYDDVLIVDVRPRFEFDVVHIAKAINLPLSSDTFASELKKIRDPAAAQPVVFYCNGHTCKKSYEAARTAVKAGFKNIYAFDSGVFDWMRTARDRTTLLEATPAPLDKMVSNEYFQARLIPFERFQKLAKENNALVIDIRDDGQRKTTITELSTVELPFDKFVEKISSGQFKDRQLLIFDSVGKQVRWLQYILEDRGYKDYFFLKGGLSSVTG